MNDVELAETMTSRPAAPDSETPETDAENATSPENGPVSPQCYSRAIALARSLERRLSLAQTEIKGHMRVEDELREAAEAELDLRMQVERDLAKAQARIAELEKVLALALAAVSDCDGLVPEHWWLRKHAEIIKIAHGVALKQRA